MRKQFPYAKIRGEKALLTAVIRDATRDYFSRDNKLKREAIAYFTGPVYRYHMELLGLEPSLLPEGVRV